ncbi:MAG TPA: asparagine synthetase B family protein [Pyrinomonadaceae bacterium]|nr:asparagine synthetase B family protein [Pyrinomonadaceae bacterium]
MEKYFFAEKGNGEIKVSGNLQAEFGSHDRVFAGWNWNGENLTVTNDRYGFYPMFYAEDKGKFAVSPSLTKLIELGFSQDFDEDAFSVFLRFGWFIGEDTMFNSIRALPPSSVLTWQDGKLKISSKGIFTNKTSDISRGQAIKIYADLFQKAVEKTLPETGDFVVPLSGGRDSRHILFALNKANRKPAACLTILHPPPRPNEDAKIAARICQTLGIKHQLLPQSDSRLDSEKRKNYLTGFSVFEHGWFLPLSDFVKGKRNIVYDGIAGDVLSAGLFLDEARLRLFEEGKFENLADKLMEAEGYLPALLTKENYQRFSREKAIRHLIKELERHADAPNPVGSFYFWNRTRRCIAPSPFRLLPDSTEILMPYLDKDVFDFLSSLPARMLLDHNFHTETIAFAYPEYASIPYEDKSSPPIMDTAHFRNYSREILLYALTKRKKKLVNRNILLSRCLRGMFDSGYSRNVIDFGELAIILLQLERLN